MRKNTYGDITARGVRWQRRRRAVGFSRLLGATRQDPFGLRGLCGVVLGENNTPQGVPAG